MSVLMGTEMASPFIISLARFSLLPPLIFPSVALINTPSGSFEVDLESDLSGVLWVKVVKLDMKFRLKRWNRQMEVFT